MNIAVTDDEKYMFSICRLNPKAKCFSTRPYFAEKIAQGQTFKSGGHWEPASHLVIAEAIKRYLIEEGHVLAPERTENQRPGTGRHPPFDESKHGSTDAARSSLSGEN